MIYCKKDCKWGTCCNVAYGHDFKMEECKMLEPVAKETNGDRIRRMNNEELAKAFTDDLCELLCGSPSVCDGDCDRRMFDWLNKECE